MSASPILRKEDRGEGITTLDIIVTVRVCVGHSGDQTFVCDFFIWLSLLCRAVKPVEVISSFNYKNANWFIWRIKICQKTIFSEKQERNYS